MQMITVPVCIDCHKPHMGRQKSEDRCWCDTVGRWEFQDIPAEEQQPNKLAEKPDA